MSSTTESKIIKIVADGKQAEASINQITRAVSALNRERNKEKAGSARYKELTEDLSNLNSKLVNARNEVKNLDSASKKFWGNFKTIAAGVVGGNLITSAMQGIGAVFSKAISKVTEMSDAFANIRKVTGLSLLEVAQLDKKLGDIDTRTGRKELRELAVEAGKLGIEGVGNIARFVKEADQINVALGEDLGEGAVTTMGRLSNIFKVSMLEIGSAINDIGASSAATEAYQVDFLNRMAGTGPTVKLAADELLGYSATLENMGQSAEVSGTALSKFFLEFIKDTEKFGQIAGMQKGKLTEIFNSQGTNAAFLTFLQNLKRSKDSATDMAKALDEMQIDGARSVGVFLSLANSIGDVEKNQVIANKAIKEGTSLTNEFNIKNENTASKWEKIQKAVSGTFNKATNEIAGQFIDLIYDMIDAPLSETLEREQVEFKMLESRIYDTNTAADERVKIINELKTQYPGYLSDINAETVSNKQLKESLDKINNSLINKIIIQKEDEKILEHSKKVAEQTMQQLKYEAELRKIIIKLNEKAKIDISDGTMSEWATDLLKSGKLNNDEYQALNGSLYRFNEFMKILNKEQAINNQLIQAKVDLQKKLGLDLDLKSQNSPISENKPTGSTSSGGDSNTGDKPPKTNKYKSTLSDDYIERPDAVGLKGKTSPVFENKVDPKLADEGINRLKQQKAREKEEADAKKQLALAVTREISDTTFELIRLRQQKELNTEIDFLDKKKNVELSNKKLTEEQRAKIEADYDAKRRAILTENAKKERRAAIIQSIVNMGLAIAAANTLVPPANIPAMIMAGVSGAAQTALIAAQPIPQFFAGGVTGAEDGKQYMANNIGSFSSGGVYNQPSVGLIGERGSELVIPNWLYKSPKMVNTMGALESMIYNAKPFANGGATTPAINNSVGFDDKELKMLLKMNMTLFSNLNKTLESGIVAKTFYDRVEYEKFNNRNEKVKSISKL